MIKTQMIFGIGLAFFSLLFGQNNLDKCYKGFEGTIVVYDQRSDIYTIYNDKRAGTPFF